MTSTQLSLLFAPGLQGELREATSTPHRIDIFARPSISIASRRRSATREAAEAARVGRRRPRGRTESG